jgi:DNA invertase Pin-like site-specific DNA recombinase
MTTNDGKPARLIAYCRVSSTGQAANGISLAEQETRVRQYARAHGCALVGVEVDRGASGRTTRRPALQRALRRLKAGEAAGLVAVRLDRISRSIRDAVNLFARAQAEGWQIVSLSEQLDTRTPSGRFLCHVLAAMAEWEREQAAERTREALGELRRQGRRVSGKPPLGYRFQAGRLVEVPEEQTILARIVGLRRTGAGPKRIAKALNAGGVKNPRTRRAWVHGTVRDIVRRVESAS